MKMAFLSGFENHLNADGYRWFWRGQGYIGLKENNHGDPPPAISLLLEDPSAAPEEEPCLSVLELACGVACALVKRCCILETP